MNLLRELPGLQIDTPLAMPAAENFRPQSWPPPNDFPIVIDSHGEIVSRYGDSTWTFTPWAGKPISISFGDHEKSLGARISADNAALFRQVTAWWLYGSNAARTAATLAARHRSLKHLFVVCSEAGVLASNLSRFPKLVEKLAARLSPSEANKTISRLHDLLTFRDALGFTLLDASALKLLAGLIPDHEATQSAYIPPRIWTYQVLRLRECLDDYLANKEQVEACYRFCLAVYENNIAVVARQGKKFEQRHNPFEPMVGGARIKDGRQYYGRFRLTAERYGIAGLLDRWVEFSDRNGVRALSSYLSMLSEVGLAYVLNFSLMRIDEGSQLRAGCYSVERDILGDDVSLLGEIHTLSGVTTKTIQDDDARWIVSPSCKTAIDVMSSVAFLRMEAGRLDAWLRLSKLDRDNPLLKARSFEPWAGESARHRTSRKKPRSYSEVLDAFPKLFDLDQLRLTSDDLVIAQKMTFGLNPDQFAVAKIWPLAWHQLRRTGACNMLNTGLVSEASLQYQLKHATRAMSRYYGQNHYKLNGSLDEEARGVYLREMYQTLAGEFQALLGDRFVSPHGEKRKAQIIAEISAKDHGALVKDAEAGRISYRQTFLGGCAKPGQICPLGGISNITGCMGHGDEPACEWAFVDKAKRPIIEKLLVNFRSKLNRAPENSDLKASLEASIESAERAINVLDTV